MKGRWCGNVHTTGTEIASNHTEQLDATLRALQDEMPDKQADVA